MIRAVIFDLDGTLADTETLHYAAFTEVLRPEGIELSRADYFARLIGYDDHDCFAVVLKENGKDASEEHIARLVERKTASYMEVIRTREVMYPGAVNFVRECAARFPLMIVTGTLRAEAEVILRRANLRELFVDVIAAEDMTKGKPDPDGFITALGRLGFLLRQRRPIEPAQSLAIEDTSHGVAAARSAGMRVLALTHTTPASELGGADLIRESWAATDLDDILRRLAR